MLDVDVATTAERTHYYNCKRYWADVDKSMKVPCLQLRHKKVETPIDPVLVASSMLFGISSCGTSAGKVLSCFRPHPARYRLQ